MERPDFGPEPHISEMTCCCGRIDCALLKKNCSILETVEKDVHTAAQLGQALLARHEAYMADAERDRLDLSSRIERLEMAKQELEAENALKIEENRNLLDQLELLNSTVSESDTKIKALEASLLSSQQAVRRLESAALRAEDAERHISLLELEQDDLYHELRSTKEDARTHAQRCKEAQRGIMDMQDQLERMEEEAREERQRHAEVIGRMERQRQVEKQLNTAAGRLKGAAASKTLQEPKPGNPVVNHFVRDLLQDNANLQLGMAELREMLLNSNDEIQSLREQLVTHQPIADSSTTLKDELEAYEPPTTPRISQELHIHHHYHVTAKADKHKMRRKRASLNSSIFSASTSSGTSTPRSSARWSLGPALPALASINTKEPNSVISMPKQRWSMLSEQPSEIASSVPSSPRSNLRNSMFDSNFGDSDYPMSPATSFDPMSPTWRTHRKGPSDISAFSLQAPSLQLDPGTPPQNSRQFNDDVIHEEDENEDEEVMSRIETPDLGNTPSIDESSIVESSEDNRDDYMPRPRIHRAISHESIMSLTGGLDIHTLKARPSQLTLRPLGGAEAVVTGVTAQPTLYRGAAKRSTAALRDTFAGLPASRTVSNPLNRPGSNRSASPAPSDTPQGSPAGGIGKWVGWRPWASGNSENAPPKPAEKERDRHINRTPGINQPGSIPGFHQYWAAQKRKGAPAQVTTVDVDREALVEGLQD
ncbi:hypothetical protein IWW34DRAFT_247871 [Fusarium oxysporum f. sp. albedinis]|nr:hypothetical protein FOMA001_g7676 [Fusarium oxysporum f. sp. matthiolae]KAI3584350.1 hypothetical protein IWW34DRAFT_247871 [Fusarium oxysporum f. sp. albedinis]KAJ0143659.1 Uncharacterized protein HZ326_13567 [Fusarium oxysporum f. sp. albedinis]KAK2480138.1 hypothetical protein H9L39_09512 [Fusarium oxysporum f. sp. albedinis]